ncbi:GHMP family kinase ATP-binding protein [Gottfriedia luciferensis]|uniref:GHMP family kinase ATP-binding protein n=1 Tax=Gottfriedia luciferensis TaxID=178774 RepID=UPI000B434BFE|nr:hypothetical protein [Gottfriedia luciferensis]
MDVNDLVLAHKQYYNHSDLRIFFVSGYSDEIVEITENNKNDINSLSQSFGIYLVTSKTENNLIKLVSLNFEELGIIEISLNDLDDEIRHDWKSYLKKTISYLKQAGYCINKGMDLLIYSNIPNEVGLSSSKTIEAITGVIIRALYE